jgi:hypothetical protein
VLAHAHFERPLCGDLSMCIAMSAFGAKKRSQLPDRLSLYSEFRSISFVRQLCQMKMLELFF